ncbi:MAG: RagB/SusD family nutrient uptake outer membrane protein [Flavobacteriaceae bacterium]
MLIKNTLTLFAIGILIFSCKKDDEEKEIQVITGNLEVTVNLGDEPAIGAIVTTNPETKTLTVPQSGVVQFNAINPHTYRVNVVLPDLEDFIYFTETTVKVNETQRLVLNIPEIPELTEQAVNIGLLIDRSYQGLRNIFDADGYISFWGDIGTDVLKANRMVNGALVNLDAYFFDPSLQTVNQVWLEHYKLIQTINQGIDLVSNPVSEIEGSQDRLLEQAELRFLRGLLYFNLVKIYGNPVLVTTAVIDFQNPIIFPQESVTTYNQIEEDLLFGIQHLPITGSNVKANRNSARALLARVYLKMAGFPVLATNKYAAALDQLKLLVDQYELENDYNQVFTVVNELQNKEVIFRVDFDGTENARSKFNLNWGPMGVSEHDELVLPSGFLQDFSATPDMFSLPIEFPVQIEDRRFFNSIATFTLVDNAIVNNSNIDFWRPLKWSNGSDNHADFASTEFDYPLLRYADVLLMLAEAENEVNGPTALAYDAINQVRRRAFGNNDNDLPQGLDKTAFFERIVIERKLELCFEGHRKDDLIRWQKLAGVIEDYNKDIDALQKDFQPHEWVWPIPQSVLDEDANIIQNQGY